MSIDPMTLMNEVRPKPGVPVPATREPGTTIRRGRRLQTEDHAGNIRDADDFATVPGSPNYRSKIPDPPCATCNSDHNPLHEREGRYDHPYLHPDQAGAMTVVDGIVYPTSVVVPQYDPSTMQPVQVAVAALPAINVKRISIFPGRGDDDYVLVVERRENDDWEDDYKQKMTGDAMANILPVLDALGVKLKDRTGGDLMELRQRNER